MNKINEAIDRCCKQLKDIRSRLGNTSIATHIALEGVREMLEAMKEPEMRECPSCIVYSKQVDGYEDTLNNLRKEIFIERNKRIALELKPDPIHEVYDKYGKLSVHDMSHDGLVNAFINMRNAITQHCEEEE